MKQQTKRPTLRHSVRVLTAAALLAATSVVLAFFAKSIFGPSPIRITFECLPIFFGSLFLGPSIGAVIAVGADLLSCFLSGMAPNLIITLGAALIGLVAGLVYRYLPLARRSSLGIVLAVFLGHLVGSMTVKSIGLFVFYGWVVLYRIPTYLVIALLESLVLLYLSKNTALMRQIGKVTKT